MSNYLELFKTRAAEIHEGKFGYNKVIYINARTKVEIICPVHGSFFQVPDSHLKGVGCRQCGFDRNKAAGNTNKKTSNEDFIVKAKEIHGEKYDYSKCNYTSLKNKITLACSTHGDFEIKAGNHLHLKAGCLLCGTTKAHEGFMHSNSDFIEKSKEVFGDKYDYSKTCYEGNKNPVVITCKEHGDFTVLAAQRHYSSNVQCPKCTPMSKGELGVNDFIESLGFKTRLNDNTLLDNKQHIDIVVENTNICIEYNGSYWHSEQMGKDDKYHVTKTDILASKGLRLLHISDADWENKKGVVKSRLRNILNVGSQKIFARKTEVRNIPSVDAGNFYNENHLQGKGSNYKFNYGLFLNNILIACMSFSSIRFGDDREDDEVELVRYASTGTVVGGFSKLLKHFLRNNSDVREVVSYADRRWSEGNVYAKNGFEQISITRPGYFYVNSSLVVYSRQQAMKHKLPKLLKDFDMTLTERQNMKNHGFFRVYDCGSTKWRLRNV